MKPPVSRTKKKKKPPAPDRIPNTRPVGSGEGEATEQIICKDAGINRLQEGAPSALDDGGGSYYGSLKGNLDSCTSEVYESADRFLSCGAAVVDGLDGSGEKAPFGGCRKSRKHKSVAISAGMVSNFLRKDYVCPTAKKGGRTVDRHNLKGSASLLLSNEEAEEFLFSVLGYDSELSMDVVRDVLCHCGYDVEQTLDALLELSASSFELESECGSSSQTDSSDSGFFSEDICNDLANRISNHCQVNEKYLSFHLPEEELHRVLKSADYVSRETSLPRLAMQNTDLQQKVLESLYGVPNSSEHKPDSMDWKKVIMKIESIGEPWKQATVLEPPQNAALAKGDEYEALREPAKQLWDAMKSYYQKAAEAYSRGHWDHAAYLSEQGRFYNEKARDADEKASRQIFEVRNRSIQNAVTIDLHGQHVKQAIKLAKLHLLLCTRLPSIRFLHIITGCGTHGAGRGKLKQSVINLLKKEDIEWREENVGSLVIKLDGQRKFSFVDSGSDSE